MKSEDYASLCVQFGNNWESVIDEITKVIGKNPHDIQAYYYLGLTHMKVGSWPLAILNMDIALTLASGGNLNDSLDEVTRKLMARIYLGVGICYSKLNNLPNASKNFKHAVILYPDYIEALSQLGTSHLKQGMISESIDDFSAVLRVDGNNIYALVQRGMLKIRCYQQELVLLKKTMQKQSTHHREKLAEAVNDLTLAMTLDKDCLPAYSHRGMALLLQGKSSLAIDDFNRVLGAESSASVHFYRARAYKLENKPEELFLEDMEKALSLDKKLISRLDNSELAILLRSNKKAAAPKQEWRAELEKMVAPKPQKILPKVMPGEDEKENQPSAANLKVRITPPGKIKRSFLSPLKTIPEESAADVDVANTRELKSTSVKLQ